MTYRNTLSSSSVLITLNSAIMGNNVFESVVNSDMPSNAAVRVVFPESLLTPSNVSKVGFSPFAIVDRNFTISSR